MVSELNLSFETAIRLCVIGQELLIAAVFLFHEGDRATRYTAALLVSGIAAYLVASDPALAEALAAVRPLVFLLALLVPCFLWAFARAIFEHPWPARWIVAVVVAVFIVSWLVLLGYGESRAWLSQLVDIPRHVVSLVIVGHALWFTARERKDDLLEGRRAFRAWFILLVGLHTSLILVAELAAGNAPMPLWAERINTLVIAMLTAGLAVPMLRLNTDLFASAGDTGQQRDASATVPVADRVLADKLEAFMEDGGYRESGLTISSLAEKLACQEYRLRRVINGGLGYRNFSAFLNAYRIRDAKRMLADRELATRPVLTIALELGYGSVGPFNRAFRQATGKTPTGYRREALGRNSVVSE